MWNMSEINEKRGKQIINNLLNEICNKVWDNADNKTYLLWLETEIGLSKNEIKELNNEQLLPLPNKEKDEEYER